MAQLMRQELLAANQEFQLYIIVSADFVIMRIININHI